MSVPNAQRNMHGVVVDYFVQFKIYNFEVMDW